MPDVLHDAFLYRDMGLSVIPLNGKTPAVPWKEFQERLASVDELKRWFRKTRHNIGIVTGQVSGVMAFDIDSHDTCNKFFGQNLPKSEMMTRSGNGRGHVYYRLPRNLILGNRVKIAGLSLDIRAEGGQCVAAPSIHPDSGQQYQRVGTWNLSETPFFDPEWIEESTESHGNAPLSVPTDKKGITSLDRYLSPIKSIQGQNGSKDLMRVCHICRDETGDFEIAYEYVKRWNESGAAVPPWSEKELLHALTNAFKKGAPC